MFSFFSRKKGPKVTDVVWMHTQAYHQAIGKWLQEHPEGRVIAWFEAEKESLRSTVPGASEANVFQADRVTTWNIDGRPLLFAGHYPVREKEEQVAEALGLSEMTVYVPMDAPFFEKFGGEKVIAMMQRLGLREDEPIKHTMVSNAIRRAQEKLAHKAGNELLAHSEAEWLRLNTGGL